MLSSTPQCLCFVQDDGQEGKEEFESALEAARQFNIPYQTIAVEALPSEINGSGDQNFENAVYVLRSFGTEVHRKLQQRRFRIVGPMCVVTTLQERSPLPESRDGNVFTLAMRGAVVCCTNVGERDDREMIHNLVTLMGGTVMRSLTQSVTHLVAGEVGSAKYSVARKLNLPIVLPTWVEEAWEISRRKAMNATSSEFTAKHRCPPLKGCCVCVTGVDAIMRKDIRTAAEDNGGVYCGELSMESTTHLIANKIGGEKYKHARMWGIPCVLPSWLFKSVENGGFEDPALHEVERGSTAPLDTDDRTNGVVDQPPADNSRKRKRPVGDASDNPPLKRSISLSRNASSGVICCEVPVAYRDLVVRPCNTAYLDGCKILLHGFGGPVLDLLRRVINCGGGTRFNQLNATVSHVVLDNASSDIQKRLETIQGVLPHIVTSSWLLESCRTESRIPEDKFPCSGMAIEQKVVAAEGDMLLLGELQAMDMGPPPPPEPQAENPTAAGNILAQYLSVPAPASSASAKPGSPQDDVTSAQPVGTTEAGQRGGVFASINGFYINTGDNVCNSLALKTLQKGSGSVVSKPSASGIYTVCSLADQKQDGVTQVTLFWLEKCVSSDRIVPPSSDPLYEPCGFAEPEHFLSSAVLSLSQYEGQLRTQLSKLAMRMGATVQDHFVRKASKGLKASTHLLCQTATGSKHAAAKRWSLPAVDHRWLIVCSLKKQLVSEKDYLINATSAAAATTGVAPTTAAASASSPAPSAVSASTTTTCVSSATTVPTSVTPAPNRSASAAGVHATFQPSFDTTDIVAALQSPAVTATTIRKRNRSSGVGLEEMFQNNLASAVGVCSTASATENTSTGAVKETHSASAASPTLGSKKAPSPNSTAGRQPIRRGRRGVKLSLDGVSVHPAPSSSQRPAAALSLPGSNSNVPSARSPKKGETGPSLSALLSPQKDDTSTSKTGEAVAMRTDQPGPPEPPSTGTLEVREAFEREMEELISLTSSRNSTGKSSSRRSSRLSRGSSARSPAVERAGSLNGITPDTSGTTPNPSFGSKSSSGEAAAGQDEANPDNLDSLSGMELSQTDVITYDDPNGRLERERIIAELMEAPEDDAGAPVKSSVTETVRKVFPLATTIEEDDEVARAGVGNSGVATTPTPPVPVPMIAALRPAAKTRPPLATADLTMSQSKMRATQLKFHITALSQAEKTDYLVQIEKLGGKVYDTMFFSTSCTHIIVGKPSRSEKYLGALASGKWLLRKSFLEASREAGHFVEEADHEWGGQLLGQAKPEGIELAAQRWRLSLQDQRLAQQLDGAPSRCAVGAFSDWRVLLGVSREKQAGLKRLLEAGGAKIVKTTPPFTNIKGVTHAFVEVSKTPVGSVDYSKLAEAGVHCCRPEYIAEHLIQHPLPDIKRYYISNVYTKRAGSEE